MDLRHLAATTIHLYDVGLTVLYHLVQIHDQNVNRILSGLLMRGRSGFASPRLPDPVLYIRVISYYTFSDYHDHYQTTTTLQHLHSSSVWQ